MRTDRRRQQIADAARQLLSAVLSYRERCWLTIADLRGGRSTSHEDRIALCLARSEANWVARPLSCLTPFLPCRDT